MIPDSKLEQFHDIVIIGAGLGGLIAGAKLAREGKKVLVIEQHDRPGGYATTFQRGDFTLEVGLHEMDGPAPGDMKTKIFNDLGVFENVDFIQVPEFYRFDHGRVKMTMPHDPVAAEEKLARLFPEETTGIKAYFNQILKRTKKIPEAGVQEISIGEYLDSILKNEELKLMLLGNLGYFTDDPYDLSLSYYTIAQGSYFTNGASFIKGGSQRLSDHLAGFIRDHGGAVFLNHRVTGIKTEGQRVTGISYQRTRDRGKGKLEVSTDVVIANTAMPNVADLLPEKFGNEIKKEVQHQKTGNSLLTIYLGFRKPVKELGYPYYSTTIFDPTVKSQKDILPNNRDDYSLKSFIFADYGQIDSMLAPEGKSVGAICCTDYLENWENLDRKAYLAKKKRVASIFIDRLEILIPGIKELIEYHEVATPYTLKRYTLNPGGAVYGFARTPNVKMVDTSKFPENLHFASAWGKTGGGYSGAIYGGYLCALSILRKRAVKVS